MFPGFAVKIDMLASPIENQPMSTELQTPPVTTDIKAADAATTVYFDGACPVCSREIAFYQRQSGGEDIAWVDVTRCGASSLPFGVTRETAMARFHVQSNGALDDGAAAFLALWRALPGFRWIGRLLSVPPLPWLLERGYRLFLKIRARAKA